FFFSSRRRHTRSKRDWSSDVCSSDLNANGIRLRTRVFFFVSSASAQILPPGKMQINLFLRPTYSYLWVLKSHREHRKMGFEIIRSEERRVGKEGSAQWRSEHRRERKQ